MPGEAPHGPPPRPASDSHVDDVGVRCPVHRVEITACDAAELAPLVAHLSANLPVTGTLPFPRGTLLGDGRLDLCKQALGCGNCLQIMAALQDNTQVRSLMLGTDAIGDEGAASVARLLARNTRLEVLYLGCNNIGPQGAQEIGAALAGADRVTGLWLKRNPLGPAGARSMARMLRTNRRLRTLDLVNTGLGDEGVQALVDALCTENRSLRSLYLSGNGLGPPAAAALARLLREAPQVEALYLGVNRLGDDGAAVIAQALRANDTLQTLELASNGIGPEGARALFSAARQHRALQALNLGYAPSTKVLGAQANHILDQGAGDAAELLAASPVLRSLDLTRNGITSRGQAILVAAVLGNEHLSHLVIDARLPPAVATHLARNRLRHGELPARADQAAIKSVYR